MTRPDRACRRLPLGAVIAARPLFESNTDRKPAVYLVNGVLAALMLIVFVALLAALGTDIYRCDVLRIPNCD
jgi:hypothetical protein